MQDIEQESFTEDDIDKEYEEFLQLQEELSQIRNETSDILKSSKISEGKDTLLAIEVQ